MEMLIPLLFLAVSAPAVKATPAVKAAPAAIKATINERLLASHNTERVALNVKPLIWSATLAADAQRWADKLALTRTFEHAGEADNKADHGENLWMGTRGAFSPEDMVGRWTQEKSLFKAGLFPNVSTNGNWMDVGHYTQLIWHNSTEVGCAIAANRTDEFLVCRYNPPGNWMGQSPFGTATQKATADLPNKITR
jgi:hypothetical protein